MTLEDPFYVVKDEVFKALNKTRGLYLRWQELAAAATPPHSPEAEWTSTELKNALRSIQWDLEDLEDTISIVEKNSSKFKIDNKEITERRKFIESTRKEVKMMRGNVSGSGGSNARAIVQCRDSTTMATPSPEYWHSPELVRSQPKRWGSPRDDDTSPLIPRCSTPNFEEPPPRKVARSLFAEQALEDELAALDASAASLRQVSQDIGTELTEHNILIEDLSGETEQTAAGLRSASLLSGRVLNFATELRQRWTILTLVILLGVVAWWWLG